MYALVIDTDYDYGLGLEAVVRLFEDEDSAYTYIAGRLIAGGSLTRLDDGSFRLVSADDEGPSYDSCQSAVDAFQDTLGMLEYCHVYPVAQDEWED